MFLSLITCCQRLIVSVNRTDCSCLDPHEGRKGFLFQSFLFLSCEFLVCSCLYLSLLLSVVAQRFRPVYDVWDYSLRFE